MISIAEDHCNKNGYSDVYPKLMLNGYVKGDNGINHGSKEKAMKACNAYGLKCGGIVKYFNWMHDPLHTRWEIRKGSVPMEDKRSTSGNTESYVHCKGIHHFYFDNFSPRVNYIVHFTTKLSATFLFFYRYVLLD